MKTFIAALSTFWEGKILWVCITDMLMFGIDNFNLKTKKICNFTSYRS